MSALLSSEPQPTAASGSGSAPSWVARVLIGLLKAYRLLLSPWIGNQCRFEPTCSRYAIEAIETHGAGQGSYLMTRRVLRCHPWCEGGFDPVPPARATKSNHILPEDPSKSHNP